MLTIADPVALALAVDARVCALPPGCDPARLFAVRLRDGGDFVLVPFWSGVAREIPARLTPPDGCWAIALDTGGWVAPLDDALAGIPPSAHPERRRMRQTALVYGDGVDVSVIECDDEPLQVLRDGVGLVADLLRACWARRRQSA